MNTRIATITLLIASLGIAAHADDTNVAARLASLESRLGAVEETQGSDGLNASWNNGFVLADNDGAFSLKLGGRSQLDFAFFDADEDLTEAKGEFDDGVRFRRVRLYLSGTLYENVFFRTEYDFASDTLAGTYFGVKGIPYIGTIRVGHQIEPTSLEENISNNYITFIERASVTAFNPVFNTGLMAYNTAADKRMTWAVGAFKDTDGKGNSTSNEAWAIDARLTGLPYISEDGRQYVHLGASYSHRGFDDNSYKISTRPHSRLAPTVVSTGSLPADSVELKGLEAVVTMDRLSIQAEWMESCVDRVDSSDPEVADSDLSFQTYYVMASCFLTGEYRPYSRTSGAVTRIKPNKNFSSAKGELGALEVAARYDVIDLNDEDISGGKMDSYTVGLNWYLNARTRVMLNYISSDVEDTGTVDTYTMRFALDF